jgi:hypothetical protein
MVVNFFDPEMLLKSRLWMTGKFEGFSLLLVRDVWAQEKMDQ